MVLREGSSHWISVQEFSGDASTIQWILLVLKEDGSKRSFVQDGPFTLAQVNEMIQSGKVRYADFAWKAGMSTWSRIGDVPEFNRRLEPRTDSLPKPDTTVLAPPPAEVTASTISSQIQDYKPVMPMPEIKPPPPKESTGVDILEQRTVVGFQMPKVDIPKAQAKPKNLDDQATVIRTKEDLLDQVTPIPERLVKKPEAAPAVEPDAEKLKKIQAAERLIELLKNTGLKSQSKWFSLSRGLQYSLAVSAAMIIGFFVVLVSNLIDTKGEELATSGAESIQVVKSSSETAPAPNIGDNSTAASAPPQAKPASAPVVSATTPAVNLSNSQATSTITKTSPPNDSQAIRLTPISGNSTNAKVIVRADVRAKVRARILGKTGQVLDVPAYLRVVEIPLANGEGRIDFLKLKAPLGLYEVLVSDGKAKSKIEIFYGTKTNDFIRKQEAHIRSIAYQQQTEKRTMTSILNRLDSQVQSLENKVAEAKVRPGIWPSFYKDWGSRTKLIENDFRKRSGFSVTAYPLERDFLSKLIKYLSQEGSRANQYITAPRGIASSEFTTVRIRSLIENKRSQLFLTSTRLELK